MRSKIRQQRGRYHVQLDVGVMDAARLQAEREGFPSFSAWLNVTLKKLTQAQQQTGEHENG